MAAVVSVFGVKPFRIGGTETFARELSLQLQERGFKSVLCFLKEPPEEVRRFLDLPNVSLEVLENSTDLNWGASKTLSQIIRRHNPQILHLHFTGFLGVYPWLARLLSVKQVFFTDHSSRPAGYVPQRAPFWKRNLARIINAPVSKVICVSRYGQRCLTTLDLLPSGRHELVYNAVDLSRVTENANAATEFKKNYAIPADRVVIVQVSWMIPEKGIPELLETARILISTNPRVHFVLVGEGAYREQFMKDAAAMGIADYLTWTGLIEDPFGEGVYEAADIVCQLSEWEELFGWMIAEAMAYGKPIVATRVGGIPELVNEGVSGFLVERGDPVTAAERINQLAGDPDLRRKLGEAGRDVVKEKFDLRRNVAELVKLYGL
ncbi:MAG TPA: glycosyltransferase family 4 protein [Pyrinomonadaceae bacterium]|jgi:glycosyltransferase involved in cell wall biosynthesis|nr:glycosyltransferase family 4 protein [Pyrinomonadaceae bacterium]